MSPAALSLFTRTARLYGSAVQLVDRVQPLFALALRIYVACVFFRSGLTKLNDWNITLTLFRNDYHVPVLPPALAAVLGTGAELLLPVFLLFGLGTRFAAAGLFVFNIVAATSYPDLSDAGRVYHMMWGALLLVTFFYGPGKFSLDHLLGRRLDAPD